jgi:predicted O-methyltransferase YrrM
MLAVSGLRLRLTCHFPPPTPPYADDAPHSAYHFPNDELELDRLDSQHEILRILLDGRNYLAPLSHENPPRKILDIATGTGRWAIEMGDEFPRTSIIGTDLSPVQPEMVPPNVRFCIDDG